MTEPLCCPICGRKRRVEDFHLDSRFHHGRKSYCKFCEPTLRLLRRFRKCARQDLSWCREELMRQQSLVSLMVQALEEMGEM